MPETTAPPQTRCQHCHRSATFVAFTGTGEPIYRCNTGHQFKGAGVAASLSADHDGDTYESARDKTRLNSQQRRVFEVMKDGRWRTLATIAEFTGDPEASVSARLRDLRKAKFGGYNIEREYVSKGLWRYRMVQP